MRRSLRYFYLKIVRQRGTPKQIALGTAIGVFVGVAMPPGIHMITALAISWVARANRAAAVLATWVSNPFTIPVFIAAQMGVGRFLIGASHRRKMTADTLWTFLKDIPHHREVVLDWGVGALAMGVVSSIVAYFVIKSSVIEFRRRKAERRHRRERANRGSKVSPESSSSVPPH